MGTPSLRAGNKLRKEIVLTLIVKILFLYLLWFLFFQEPDLPLPASQQFENHVFGIPATPDPSSTNSHLLTKEP